MSLPALAPEDLAVGRLRLAIPESAPAGETAAMRRRLDQAWWPRAPGESWVLVRRVRVRGSGGSLAARASAALDERVRAAAEAGTPGAERADAIRFRDLSDLLARLCADLVAGHAAERWYWQRWPDLLAQSAGEAIGSLLGSHAERLTTVTERLAGHGALAAVWRTLTPARALDLLGHLAARIGTPLPAGPHRGDGDDDRLDLPPLPAGLRARWSPALAGLSSSDPRRRLAAALVALEWRPLWLSGAASARVLDALGAALDGTGDSAGATGAPGLLDPGPSAAGDPSGSRAGNGAETRRHPPAPGRSIVAEGRAAEAQSRSGPGEGSAFPRGPGEIRPAAPDGGPTRLVDPVPGAGSGEDLAAGRRAAVGRADNRPGSGGLSARARIGDTGPTDVRPSGRVGPGALRPAGADADRPAMPGTRPTAGPEPALGPETGTPAPADPAGTAAPGAPLDPACDLETGEGGLFYLVNFLARPEAQALLRAGRDLSLPGSPGWDGWSWLWDLGRRLGLARDGALARFLAERMGLAGADALAAFPDLPAGPDLLDLGERLYGRAEVWNRDLLQVPARLRHSASHLDVDYPLAAVRLPVRLVALDVDPGWVPWLGRVVTFRYRDAWSGPAVSRGPPR